MLDGHPSLEVLPQDVANQMIPHPNHPRSDFQDYHSSVVWKILSFQQRYTSNKTGKTKNISTTVHTLHSIFLGHMVIRKEYIESGGTPSGISFYVRLTLYAHIFSLEVRTCFKIPCSVLTYRQNDCSPEILIFIEMGGVILTGIYARRNVGVVPPTSLPFQILKKRFILFHVSKYFFLHVYKYTVCMPDVHRDQKRVLDSRNWSNGQL